MNNVIGYGLNWVWPNRLLLLPAAVVLAALMSLYVDLLHQSVARGESLRQEQRMGMTAGGANSIGVVARGSAADAPSLALATRH